MNDLQNTLELAKWAREVISNTTQLLAGTTWVDSLWFAVLAVAVGLLLALWGGRLLRTGVILAFMTVGAIVGKQVAGSVHIDLLIGLVIGAGIVGLIGYVFYRWWLALIVGAVVTLALALTFTAPRLLDERRGFEDFRLGVGSSGYTTSYTSQYSATEVRNYFWDQRRGFVYKTLGPVVIVGLLAAVVAILAPRLASIVGTSMLGVLLVAGGGGVVLASKWPDIWTSVQSHQTYALAGLGLFWLFALMYQFTHPPRPTAPVSVAPAPTPTA